MHLARFSYSGNLAAPSVTRAQIDALELAIQARPQRECPVQHEFLPGQYVRRMFVPPWTVLTGAEHTTEHLVRLEAGVIEVLTQHGLELLRAPFEFISRPGIKRVGRTFAEGAVWACIHKNPDDCRDLDVIVERISTSKNSDLLGNRPALFEVKTWLLD